MTGEYHFLGYLLIHFTDVFLFFVTISRNFQIFFIMRVKWLFWNVGVPAEATFLFLLFSPPPTRPLLFCGLPPSSLTPSPLSPVSDLHPSFRVRLCIQHLMWCLVICIHLSLHTPAPWMQFNNQERLLITRWLIYSKCFGNSKKGFFKEQRIFYGSILYLNEIGGSKMVKYLYWFILCLWHLYQFERSLFLGTNLITFVEWVEPPPPPARSNFLGSIFSQ